MLAVADRDGVPVAGGRPYLSRLEWPHCGSVPYQIFLVERLHSRVSAIDVPRKCYTACGCLLNDCSLSKAKFVCKI